MTFDLNEAIPSGSALKFAEVGDTHTLTITSVVKEERDNYDQTGTEEVIVISGTDAGGDDVRLFMPLKGKPGLRMAVREATDTLDVGGVLTIKRVEDGTPKNPRHQPPHMFKAKYEPPAKTTSANLDEDPF